MAVTDKVLLTMIRLRVMDCMACRYGEPTIDCDDKVHNLLREVRDIIEGGQVAIQHSKIQADLCEMRMEDLYGMD